MTTQSKLQRYLFETSVADAGGVQTWWIDATSQAEALEKYHQGDGEIYSQEVEVTSLGDPFFVGVTSLDDFGVIDAPESPGDTITIPRETFEALVNALDELVNGTKLGQFNHDDDGLADYSGGRNFGKRIANARAALTAANAVQPQAQGEPFINFEIAYGPIYANQRAELAKALASEPQAHVTEYNHEKT